MALYDQDEADNLVAQELLRQRAMNTVQPGMEEPQGTAPVLPLPKAMSSTGIQSGQDVQRQGQEALGQAPTTAPDTSKWDTDGYAKPGYTASNAYGLPQGYGTGSKWEDPNKQSPKYVVGRILQEAAGGSGNLADPEKRAVGIANVLKAYPGSVYNGKDKITFPDGGTVDVFGKAGAGLYEIAWMPETGPGGAPLPNEGQGPSGMPGVGGSSVERINSLVPTDVSTYQTLLKKLQGIIGPEASDREALMNLLNR